MLGSLDRRQLDPQVVREALVELVVVQVGRLIGHVQVGGRLVAVLWLTLVEASHDPLTLGGEQLASPVGIHAFSLHRPVAMIPVSQRFDPW